jgi:hypothetical protein
MRTEKSFGVVLGLKKGNLPFLSHGSKGPALFDRRSAAQEWKHELAQSPHRMRGKVVAVTLTWEEP